MPAVTVDDLTVLPRLKAPGLGDTVRPVVGVTTAPSGFEGEGFPVRRAFAGVDLAVLDPFVHLDQMGEVDYAPGEPKGTPWHPHRGFETVTYMIDGVFDHQDSQGGGGTITNGDTQWMTAGSGLLHIEAPPEWLVVKGGLFHGVQLWVNLPREEKWVAPRYQDLRSSELGSGSSPVTSAGRRGQERHTHRWRCCMQASPPERGSTSRGRSSSTRWCTCCPVTARSGPRGARSTAASSRCSVPGTSSP
jgi:redox-sensitive bicupin YhaK (pirin superfamily)